MAKITLNLGAVLSELLKGANSNFTELYNAISKIQETIADDGEKAVVYATVDAMVTGLNTGKDGAGNDLSITIGDEIYILDDETPDFWVSAVSTTATTGTKPASWEKDTNYAFGKYTIRVSKSREIDLTDYQKIANLVTSIGADSDDTHYPSAKAVYDAVKDKVDKVTGKGLSTNDYTNDEKTKVTENTKARHSHSNKALLDAYDQTNANIKDAVTKKHSHSNKTVLDGTTASYTTEEKTKLGNIDDSLLGVTADQIGKVKDVTVNGKSVLNSNGTAVITISELKSGYVSITTADSRWTTKAVNGTTYQALKVEKTSMAIEVYNSNNQKIVAQNVFDDSYLYICVGTAKIACTLRTMSGSSVGGGDWSSVNFKSSEYANVVFDEGIYALAVPDYGMSGILTVIKGRYNGATLIDSGYDPALSKYTTDIIAITLNADGKFASNCEWISYTISQDKTITQILRYALSTQNHILYYRKIG